MKNDDFIGRLVEETYNYLGSEELPAEFSRFEAKERIERYPADDNHLFRFLNTQACDFTHVTHRQETGCFRLKLAGQTIDVPSNWSFFSKLNKFSVSKESIIYEIEDQEFTEVFAEMVGEKNKLSFLVVSGRAYFIASHEENFAFIKAWLQKYLEGEGIQIEKEAA